MQISQVKEQLAVRTTEVSHLEKQSAEQNKTIDHVRSQLEACQASLKSTQGELAAACNDKSNMDKDNNRLQKEGECWGALQLRQAACLCTRYRPHRYSKYSCQCCAVTRKINMLAANMHAACSLDSLLCMFLWPAGVPSCWLLLHCPQLHQEFNNVCLCLLPCTVATLAAAITKSQGEVSRLKEWQDVFRRSEASKLAEAHQAADVVKADYELKLSTAANEIKMLTGTFIQYAPHAADSLYARQPLRHLMESSALLTTTVLVDG